MALLTSCGSSMRSMTDKWGWTDVNPDPGPKFGDKTPPPAPVPAASNSVSVSTNAPAHVIGNASSHIDPKTLPPPPKASETPEITLPKN